MCHANFARPLSPLAHRVHEYLAQRAGDTDPAKPFTGTISYSELCTALDPERRHWRPRRYKGIGQILAEVSSYEYEYEYEYAHGRPMLSALVVLKYSRRPGKGFAKLARSLGEKVVPGQEMDFWRNEVERVIVVWTGRQVPVTH